MKRSAIDRLMDRVVETPGPMDTPCWVPTFARDSKGYVWVRGEQATRAHRVAYEALVGPIPAGLHIDHLCRVRACCNPAHLEAVTNRVNFLRGESPNAIAHRTDTCKRGHSLLRSYDNGNGGRACAGCASLRYYARKAA